MKKDDKIKLLNKLGKWLIVLLLCVFTTLYVSSATGHYEYEQQKKVSLTAEKIEQFEKDVAAGKKIKVEDYMENSVPNYQNKTSQLGLDLSENVGKYISLGIKGFFKEKIVIILLMISLLKG